MGLLLLLAGIVLMRVGSAMEDRGTTRRARATFVWGYGFFLAAVVWSVIFLL